MKRSQSGFQLLELVIVLALFILLATLTAPPLLRISSKLRLRLAAEEISSAMNLARALAVRHCANVALKFHPKPFGAATWSIYRDGDGDGVLNKDIASGKDPLLTKPRRLEQIGNRVRFGFPPGRRVRDPGTPGEWLRGDDPIRFNSSDLASFSPLGGSTPGTVYLTDGQSQLAAVRVTGRTGKVKVLVYDFGAEVWK